MTIIGKVLAQPFQETKLNQTETVSQRAYQGADYIERGPALEQEKSYVYDTKIIE